MLDLVVESLGFFAALRMTMLLNVILKNLPIEIIIYFSEESQKKANQRMDKREEN